MFLRTFGGLSSIIELNSQALTLLWNTLINPTTLSSDKKTLYVWMRELIDEASLHLSKGLRPLVSLEDLTTFYTQNLDLPT